MQTKQFHVIPNTLFPCLPTPSPTSRPLHHQPSASRTVKFVDYENSDKKLKRLNLCRTDGYFYTPGLFEGS